MPNENSGAPLHMRATYYIPIDMDMRMEQAALEIRLNHGLKVTKSELIRAAVDLLLSLNPAKIVEILS